MDAIAQLRDRASQYPPLSPERTAFYEAVIRRVADDALMDTARRAQQYDASRAR